MSYIVGQYNKSSSTNSMTALRGGQVARIPADVEGGTGFQEECLIYNNIFSNDTTYYFHGQIKKLIDKQSFNIQLMNDNDFTETQLIKNLVVDNGVEGWVDIEFLFTPIKNFNKLAFVLNRNVKDYYEGGTRYPVIIYQELSRVNNLLPTISNGNPLIKIGIQSRPGLITDINGEEIRLGRNGIYEFKNGLLEVSSFSVVSPANMSVDVSAIKTEIDEAYPETDLETTDLSRCLFDYVSSRDLTDFSLDYVYEEG